MIVTCDYYDTKTLFSGVTQYTVYILCMGAIQNTIY